MAFTSASFNLNDLDNFFDEASLKNLHNFAKKVENVFASKPDDIPSGLDILYDIVCVGDKYVVCIDVPGINKDQLNLSFIPDEFDAKVLKLSFKRVKEDMTYIKCFRKYGSFDKKIKLPFDVDVSKNMVANYKDGVLKVTLSKKKNSEEGIKIPID